MDKLSYIPLYTLLGLYAGSPEAGYGYKFLRDVIATGNGVPIWSTNILDKFGALPFIFTDPAAPSVDYTALPLQGLFNASPVPLLPTHNTSVMISRTGWPSNRGFNSDTWTWLFAPDFGMTNIYGAPGTYELAKRSWLIADDGGADNCSASLSCYGNDVDKTSYIELGGTNNLISPSEAPGAVTQDAELSRYSGDSQNRYAYTLADLTHVYNSNVAAVRVHRHFLDFKKTGTQQFLILYDDVQTASPQFKRTFLQYPQNGGTGEGNTAFDSESGTIISKAINASVVSKVILPVQPATFTDLGMFRCPGFSPCPGGATTNTLLIAKNASAAYPYIYRAGGAQFSITSPVMVTLSGSVSGSAYFYLTPDGQLNVGHTGLSFSNLAGIVENTGVTGFPDGCYPIAAWKATNGVWASEGSYSAMTLSSSAGQTRRFIVSDGVTTNSEFLVVHMPSLSSAPELPPTTLLTDTGPNFRGVLIGGADPKVAVFGRNGLLYNRAAFVALFKGQAQIIVTGLAPGTYKVTRGRTTVLTSAEVHDKDNTLYFESVSGGAFQVSQISPTQPLALAPVNLADGTVGLPYSQALSATGGTPPYFWSITGGTIPDGLTLTQDGILQGTPLVDRQYSFTVTVQDSAKPPASAQEQALLNVNAAPPPALQLTVDGISAQGAVAHYGMPGLDINQQCTLLLSTDSSLNSIVEQYTDSGGPALRDYAFGQFVPLTDSTIYYASVTCGAATALTQFVTLPAATATVPRGFLVTLRPLPSLKADSVPIECPITPDFDAQARVAFAGACSAHVDGPSQGIVCPLGGYRDGNNLVTGALQYARSMY